MARICLRLYTLFSPRFGRLFPGSPLGAALLWPFVCSFLDPRRRVSFGHMRACDSCVARSLSHPLTAPLTFLLPQSLLFSLQLGLCSLFPRLGRQCCDTSRGSPALWNLPLGSAHKGQTHVYRLLWQLPPRPGHAPAPLGKVGRGAPCFLLCVHQQRIEAGISWCESSGRTARMSTTGGPVGLPGRALTVIAAEPATLTSLLFSFEDPTVTGERVVIILSDANTANLGAGLTTGEACSPGF